MRYNEVLSPLTSRPKRYDIAAFDIEGVGGEDGFVSGTIYDPASVLHTNNRQHFIDELCSRRYEGWRLYAHYLTYDFGMLLPYLRADYVARLMRGKIFKVVIDIGLRHNVVLADSLGMFANLPLEAVGKAIGLPKYPTPPSLLPAGSKVEEWHCKAHGKLWCERCYNVRDAEIVQKGMAMLQDTLLDLGSDLHNTLASTAMALFRRVYLTEEYKRPPPFRNDFARLGYYGGRVEPYVLGRWQGVNYYDFHSLYPSVMLNQEYPDPNYLRGPCANSDPRYIYEYEGLSEVEVEASPMHIPILPLRARGKLYFPVGRMRGVWTHAELRYALSHGYKLKSVYRTMYSTKTCNPFKPYVNALWTLRQAAKRDGVATELVYKIMLNSLYGKFGQGRHSALETLVEIEDVSEDMPLTGFEIMTILDRLYLRKPVKTVDDPAYVIVPWAAYITSYARMALHRQMEAVDYKVMYTDTDSLFVERPLPTGDGLGQLGAKALDVQAEFLAPKMYRYIGTHGEPIDVCKGVPAEYRAAYFSNKEVEFAKAVGILEAAVRKLTPCEWVNVTRVMRETDPKREYYRQRGLPEGVYLSRPFDVARLPL